MSKPVIDTIIFDLGGVLIDWNPEYVFRQIFDDEKEMHYFLTEVCAPDWNVQQDKGRSLAEGTAVKVAEFPDYQTEIEAYYGRWEEMLKGPIHESVQMFKDLHEAGTHRLLALTNWSAETFPIALERYDFLQLFEGIVVSGHEKVIKPQAEIYQIAIERYQISQPERALFLDDSMKNVFGARAVGLQSEKVNSPARMREVFVDYGIIKD
ncbi:MAG: HAD family phosphatase [Saprospiraceae bacterium]|nr:HAD family phosphatase [Saprospiraceae bacterium]